MSPRPYRLGRREASVEETRDRVLRAARDVFSDDGFFEATLDDVAARAGVARATVYYQFKSKFGLMEAAMDGVAESTSLDGMRKALDQPDPIDALRSYIRETCKFWASDFVFFRNITGLASIDPEAARAVDTYYLRRRETLVFLAKRLEDAGTLRRDVTTRHATDEIWTLTCFRSFDHLFRRNKLSLKRVTDLIQGMADGLLVNNVRLPLRGQAG